MNEHIEGQRVAVGACERVSNIRVGKCSKSNQIYWNRRHANMLTPQSKFLVALVKSGP